jgi:Bacterial Ig-like domain (group 3)/WD40-like Beta Propeller Repeat
VTTHGAVRRRPLGIAFSIVILVALVFTALTTRFAPAHASLIGDPTAIYYGDAPVASVLPDGTTSIEYTALAGLVSGTVVVSPDRNRVAWDAPSGGPLTDLKVANLDGTGAATVWAGASAGRPVWKADGSALAFLGQLPGKGPAVFIQSLAGSDASFVSSSELGGQFEPTDWSADGDTLIGTFTATEGCDGPSTDSQVSEVALLQLATHTVTTLTHDCYEGTTLVRDLDPALSSDGTQLAFIRYGSTQSLDVMGAEGSHRRQVFTGNPCCAMPAWSPDGTKLAYYTDLGNNNAGIYVMNVDGSASVFVAPALLHPALIQWGQPGNPSGALASAPASAAPTVDSNAPRTTIAFSANPAKAIAPSPVTLTATVQAAVGHNVPAGHVQFTDTTTSRSLASPLLVNGSATVTIVDLAAGDHLISATYEPADPTAFAPSSTPTVDVALSAPSSSSSDQHNSADVGGLTITTPYSPGHPLDLGPLVLDASGTALSSSTTFGCVGAPNNALYVTDARAGNPNWSAYISATDFTDSAAQRINSENLGLTGLTLLPLSGATAGSTTHAPDLQTVELAPAVALDARDAGSRGLKNGPHLFAVTPHGGAGSVGICGTLTLTAPTSTPPGVYSSSLTVTIG